MNQEIKKIKIYVISHKQFRLPVNDPIYVPLMVGDKYGNLPVGCLCDSYGDSIHEKNPRYNELTGMYWVWKNSDADIVGVCHYRRFFTTLAGKTRNIMSGKVSEFITGDYIRKILKSYDVILHNKTITPSGNQKQLCVKESDTEASKKSKLSREILDLVDAAFKEMYPEDYLIYKKVMDARYAHLLNMIICHKKIFDRYCEWLFPFLYMAENKIDKQFPKQELARCMGLIAERLLDVWVLREKLHIKECFTVNAERIDWKPW